MWELLLLMKYICWMKKKEVIEVLEKVMPFEVASWKKNMFIKDEFRNLIVK